jgi:hypothetical protein
VGWKQRGSAAALATLVAGATALASCSSPLTTADPRSEGSQRTGAGDEAPLASPDDVSPSFSTSAITCRQAVEVPPTGQDDPAFLEILDAQAELSNLLVRERVADDPTFAGAWLDGDVLTIASTDGKLGAELRPTKGSIKLRVAGFTKAELDAVAEEIAYLGVDSVIGDLAHEISYVSVDECRNLVSVGVMADFEEAEAAFENVYGDIVSVFLDERPVSTADPAIRQRAAELLATLPEDAGGVHFKGVQVVDDSMWVGHTVDAALDALGKERGDAASVFRWSDRPGATIGAITVKGIDGVTLLRALVDTWNAPAVIRRSTRVLGESRAWTLVDRLRNRTVLYRRGDVVYVASTDERATLDSILADMPPPVD